MHWITSYELVHYVHARRKRSSRPTRTARKCAKSRTWFSYRYLFAEYLTQVFILCEYYSLIGQEAQLSPSDRAMRLVSSNLANYHATVQKLLIRQVLAKPMVCSWRFSWRQCVINKPTTVELCISPVYRRLAVAKFSKSTM